MGICRKNIQEAHLSKWGSIEKAEHCAMIQRILGNHTVADEIEADIAIMDGSFYIETEQFE